MTDKPIDSILHALQERAKELECLYRVEEILGRGAESTAAAMQEVIGVVPGGWQYPAVCRARLVVEETAYESPDFHATEWVLRAPLVVQGRNAGHLAVYYTRDLPAADEGPFLKEERRLIDAIADRLVRFLEHKRLQETMRGLAAAGHAERAPGGAWRVIVDFLRATDRELFLRVGRKMLNHLSWNGVPEALDLLQQNAAAGTAAGGTDENRPSSRQDQGDDFELVDRTLAIAAQHLSEDEILVAVQRWIKEENSRFLVQALGSEQASSEEIAEAIRRFHHRGPDAVELSPAVEKGLRVALVETFLSDQLEFIQRAKQFVHVDDFYELAQRTIFPPKSRGKIGGKGAGLFLAMQVLRRAAAGRDDLGQVKAPRTWYIASDGIVDFIRYNELEDVYNQKYADIDQVRQEYPHIVQLFKNSQFSPHVAKALATVLDEFEGVPIIVRSSSLLEDRFGAAFSGKYKSLFLANQGSKGERLTALTDAIAEIYASTFAPDPIQYRTERDLLDAYEEMGVMIQEVVGTRAGKWFLPVFSGVAFSHNEFRWSARIRREDGLVRLVPGLGTRAVDRLKDDYPVLLAPGQPGLRVNVTPDEVVKYAPKMLDAIDLETGAFTTVPVQELLRDCGDALPLARRMVSVFDGERVHEPVAIDFRHDNLVVTFEGLARSTPFVRQIRALLDVLSTALGRPVDIEFASDGRELYLLQCRAQSSFGDSVAVPIPRDIPADRVLFTANRFVSNGRVANITHIVYVDPERYMRLADVEDLREVGRIVGRLNHVLPKRQFVLMGPGRWGSRGDIKLGVDVTYGDISNTAVLIEIARRKGNYVPDLSFGTHFFQDLVESSIRYLPLYPDDEGIVFDTRFLTGAPSILAELLPGDARLADVVRVIDVPQATRGLALHILMNTDLELAVGMFAAAPSPSGEVGGRTGAPEVPPEHHWRWRLRFAERIAAELDPQRSGVHAAWVIGSTKNATAGPASDIDLLLHFRGTEEQRRDLENWLQGWSLALAEMNWLRTGYRTAGLLDAHLLTDEDFAKRTSFALKVGAVTDPARPLALGTAREENGDS